LQIEAIGVARVLQSEKTQLIYWTQWTFRPLKNANIQTKTHEMDVLEALEDETLESHNRSRGFESLRAHKKTSRLTRFSFI
jgi:hypothetical protein